MTKIRNQSFGHQTGKAWLVILLLLVVAAGILYYFYVHKQQEPSPLSVPPQLPETVEPLEPEEALPEAPAEEIEVPAQALAEEAPEETARLPELARSDDEAMRIAGEVLGEEPAATYLVTDGLLSKLVATIDALSGDELPGNIIPVRSPGGEMLATSDGVSDEINPETGLPEPIYVFDPVNFQRYTPQVEVFEAIDVDDLLENYRYYYPLLQQSYRELGFGEGEFDARLLEVIDELLATPEPNHPVQLIKPEAFYEFLDPELEALPAGQKILVRMGPSNAFRVKRKLREIRAAIQTQRE